MTATVWQRFGVSAHPLARLGVLGAIVILIDGATPYLHHRYGAALFTALMLLHAAIAYVAVAEASAAEARHALILIVAVAFAARGLLLATDPYLSTDIWRYVWDGRVHGRGINPYLYIPAAPELAHLRDAAIYPNINRADYAPTIYPPMAQWVFYVVTRFADSMRGMKIAMVGFDAATMAAIVAILRRLGRPAVALVAYAWHPLPIWEIAGNGHVDAVMIALLCWALWAAASGWELAAGVLAALGALVKPTALLALPAIWRPWNWRLVGIVIAVIGLMYVPYLSAGWGVFGFGRGYLNEEGVTNGAGFWLLQILGIPYPMPIWIVVLFLSCASATLIGLALAAGFRRDRSADATLGFTLLSVLVFLDFLSPNYPWYFLVVTPFLSLTRATSPWLGASTVFVFYDVIPDDTSALPLKWAKIALYAAFTAMIVFDLRTGRLPCSRDSTRGHASS